MLDTEDITVNEEIYYLPSRNFQSRKHLLHGSYCSVCMVYQILTTVSAIIPVLQKQKLTCPGSHSK